jgi:hypothetical protein
MFERSQDPAPYGADVAGCLVGVIEECEQALLDSWQSASWFRGKCKLFVFECLLKLSCVRYLAFLYAILERS